MLSVLVVDDNRDSIIFVANKVLKPRECRVITARDGVTGLRKARKEEPDLIVTDLKLPQMDGLAMLAELYETGPRIPAIVMTFHGSEQLAVQALRLGVRDYLIKPFGVDEFEAAMERALSKAAERADLETTVVQQQQQIEQMKQALAERADKTELAEMARQVTLWEEDNARLNRMLAEAKEKLEAADSRVKVMQEMMAAQRKQMSTYHREVETMVATMQQLSEAMQDMAQEMGSSMMQLTVLSPDEKES